MWNLRTGLLFIYIYNIISVLTEDGKSRHVALTLNVTHNQQKEIIEHPVQEQIKWAPEESLFPVNFSSPRLVENNTKLELTIEYVHENISFTALVNPFIKDEKNCPKDIKGARAVDNLRKFCLKHSVIKGQRPVVSFVSIFTGCYYFKMVNAEGITWVTQPYFFHTNHLYFDTMLTCKKYHIIHETFNDPLQFIFDIEIPSIFLLLRCKLYAVDPGIKISDLPSQNNASQECDVTYNGAGQPLEVTCKNKNNHFTLNAKSYSDNSKGWSTVVKWNNLSGEEPCYYYQFDFFEAATYLQSGSELRIWQPVVKETAAYICDIKKPDPSIPKFDSLLSIIFIIIGGIVSAVVVIYWMTKLIKYMKRPAPVGNEISVAWHESGEIFVKTESNQILLMYAKGCPEFMRELATLRDSLEQASDCRVRDVYAINEWRIVAEFGTTQWVDQVLKDGSKVVWVDTPQFRSCLNAYKSAEDKGVKYDAVDFRDAAIPYAVAAATELSENATAQYSRHFVVRFEGFKVEAGQEDPLLVVSPHARYYLPQQRSLLREHLKDPKKRSEGTSNME